MYQKYSFQVFQMLRLYHFVKLNAIVLPQQLKLLRFPFRQFNRTFASLEENNSNDEAKNKTEAKETETKDDNISNSSGSSESTTTENPEYVLKRSINGKYIFTLALRFKFFNSFFSHS